MAATLDSSRSVSVWSDGLAGGAAAQTTGNKNKTSTICFNLGLIFRRTAHFFGALQQHFHPLRRVPVVRLEVQLRDFPQIEPARQFVPQIMPGVVQSGQGGLLFTLV